MGSESEPTTVYVGLARLPQPPVAPAPTIAVELEVGVRSRRIVDASVSLQLPALARLLREAVAGRSIDGGEGEALRELESRYSAPFATALRAAVSAAFRRAEEAAEQPHTNGHSTERVALSSV
jgi:hypothetical protein